MKSKVSIGLADVLKVVPVPVPPLPTLEALHEFATRMATGLQDKEGECPSYFFLSVAPTVPVLMLEARWPDDEHKQAALYFVRQMIERLGVDRYAFIGEAYAVRVDQPGKEFKRSDLPRSLKDDPRHYEVLMSFAFASDGREMATCFEFEAGKPETRKPSDLGGEGGYHTGRLWNLFIARA
jgi:hypothetical protein